MIPCLFCAAGVDPSFVQFFAARYLGKYSFVPALIKAHRYFNIPGYLFFALFRFIPYLALLVILIAIDNSKKRNWLAPTFRGRFIGILGFMVWATREVVAPLYTIERMCLRRQPFRSFLFFSIAFGQA